MHEYEHFAKFGGPMNSAMRPKKQPNAAETGIRSMHCSRGVNADANMG